MKKQLVIMLAAFVFTSGLYGQVVAKPKIKQYLLDKKIYSEKWPVYKFEGFGFNKYIPSKIGLKDIVKAEYEYIKDKQPTGNFSIFGHSQGGLRVLAFASYVKKNDTDMFNRLKTVISVSGITQGIKALEGGLPAANAKIRRDLDILLDGAYGLVAVFSFVDVLDSIGWLKSETVKGWAEELLFGFLYKAKPETKKWLEPALTATSAEKAKEVLENMGEIRDMIPQSKFIRENVIETDAYMYRVQIDTKRTLRWKKVTNRWGWRYWALRWHYTPVYGYAKAYKKTAKFPDETVVGYIVGTKNNALSNFPSDKEKNIRKTFTKAGNLFAAARGIHIAKCVAIYGLFVGSPKYARDCRNARDYCRNIDDRINILLGSDEHDGLVAKTSQYIPHKELDNRTKEPYPIHLNTLPGRAGLYRSEFYFNHREIINQDEVKAEIKAMIDR